MKTFSRLLAMMAVCFTLAGCGDSVGGIVGDVVNPISDAVNRVDHVSWNTYNVYSFQNGGWVPVISRGEFVAGIPDVGNRPTMIVHGLGSDIASGGFNELATSLQNSGATSVLGFEYDTLDPIDRNANFLIEAFGMISDTTPGQTWSVAAHSMGVLVARGAFESGIPFNIAATGNRATLVAGPNLGTPVANEVQARPDLVQESLQLVVLNNKLDFRNLDGERVEVDGQEQGFTDLRTDSAFISNLNVNAANDHPQWDYRTFAGNFRGEDYQKLDNVLGIDLDDGLVDIESANAALVGQVQTAVASFDHTSIVEAPDAILQILSFMGFGGQAF